MKQFLKILFNFNFACFHKILFILGNFFFGIIQNNQRCDEMIKFEEKK